MPDLDQIHDACIFFLKSRSPAIATILIAAILFALLAGAVLSMSFEPKEVQTRPVPEEEISKPDSSLPPPGRRQPASPRAVVWRPEPSEVWTAPPPRPRPNRRVLGAALMGLVWLKNHQNPDGMWSGDRFTANCKKGGCEGVGSTNQYDTGLTGLALLAYLDAGHTHKHGKFKRTVKKALKAMKDRQLPDGGFGPRSSDGRWIYNHLVATAAVCQAYGMSHRTPLLHGMAQKAVDCVVEAQNPYSGWRYGRRPGDSDTSCTVWAVYALHNARLSGLIVPKEAYEGARRWLRQAADKNTGQVGYLGKADSIDGDLPLGASPHPEAMTAAALWAAGMLNEKSSPRIEKMAERVKDSVPVWDVKGGTIDMMHWFLGANAMWQLGGVHWKAWRPALLAALVPTQHRKGCMNGSWDPVGPWGIVGGRVYATALNTLTLQNLVHSSAGEVR